MAPPQIGFASPRTMSDSDKKHRTLQEELEHVLEQQRELHAIYLQVLGSANPPEDILDQLRQLIRSVAENVRQMRELVAEWLSNR